MKKLLFAVVLAAASVAFAASQPFSDYGSAMKSDVRAPMAVEWHNKVGSQLEAETSEEALAAVVVDVATAKALLAQVKGAYATDPLVATKIAAVSQWVMTEEPCFLLFWKPSPGAGRKVWVRALAETAADATDVYVRLFCLDQIRWCGCTCPCLAKRLEAIKAASAEKSVKDMVDLVLRETQTK